MKNSTRKVLDKSFTTVAYSSLALMCLAVLVFLVPIVVNGVGAFIFKATVEHDKFLYENLGDRPSDYWQMVEKSGAARAPLYKMMNEYENPADEAALKKAVEEARAKCIAETSADTDMIVDILKNEDSAARLADLRALAAKIWAPYVAEVSRLTEESLSNGDNFAMYKILKAQAGDMNDIVKRAMDKMFEDKKLSFTQKSAFRRNIATPAVDEISKDIQKLESANAAYNTFKKGVFELLGPQTPEQKETLKLLRQKYGQTRMNLAEDVLENSVLKINIKAENADGHEVYVRVNTPEYFKSTPVEHMIKYIEGNMDAMLQPHWTLYMGFFFDNPYDSNIFGGIWPMILGTFYLTVGAMILAAPLGIIAAIYFAEYAGKSTLVSILRMCVGTLAGVPSIVFGLFGLTFLINTLKVSESKSVLAGSITLALLILPTIIRACEEAIKSVPNSYREASLGLGAGKWKSICSVILPSAMPGMLTGIIISMGRAAGETAPIIFTAATSTGAALAIWEIFSQATPALPWNIYNMCSEHEMADKVQHVQYGMVLTLIGIVLALNLFAIIIRAKLQKKLRT